MTIAPSSSILSKLAILATILAPKVDDATADDGAGAAPAGAPTGKLWKITVIKAGRALTGDDYPAEVLKVSLDIFRGLPINAFRFGDDVDSDDPNSGFHHLPEEHTGNPSGQPASNVIGQITEEVWWNEAEQSIEAFAAIDDTGWRDRLTNTHARGAIGNGAEVDVFGFSIFAQVLKTEDNRVAKFVKGESIELVTNPAAGGAFVSIVAEAPSEVPMLLAALRAEGSLTDDAMLRVILEEVSRRIDSLHWGREADELTSDQKRAALAALAQDIIGMESGATPPPAGSIEAAVMERFEQAKREIKDDPQEGIMDAATITKLVAETVKAGLAAAKAEDDAAAAAAKAADPIADLKVWLESLAAEEKSTALQQVQSMLAEIGAMIESGAGGGMTQDEFAALTAELKKVTEEKDSKKAGAKLAKVLEGLTKTDDTPSPEALELKKLKEEMRDQALTHELEKLGPELGLHNAAAVLGMADVSGVTIKGTEVTGLREALEAVKKDNPWVAGEAKASAGDGTGAGDGTPGTTGSAGDGGGAGAGDADAALKKAREEAEKAKVEAEAQAKAAADKAAELQALSAASIRESVDAGGISAIPDRVASHLQTLQMRIARGGDLKAMGEYKAIRDKLIGTGA